MDFTAGINSWVGQNLWLVPAGLVLLAWSALAEVRRLHKRIDAILTLLRLRGIDITDVSGLTSDPDK